MSNKLFDKQGELCHVRDIDGDIVINSLRGQYKNEMELISLLSLIVTFERVGLM